MFSPTTGLQVASHDAWLAEMRKEPTYDVRRVSTPKRQGRLMKAIAQSVARGVKGIRSRRWPDVNIAPDVPAQVTGTTG